MRRLLVVALPLVSLLLFIFIMLSGHLLKLPMGQNDNVPQLIESVSEHILADQWEEAQKEAEALELAWQTVIKRIQFSSERDEINFINTNLARLKGAMKLKDKSNAIMELSEALEHWNNLGR